MAVTLSLGPLLFNWPADKRRDFYYQIADEAPVDTVYIGEVVCSKREPFQISLLPDIIERLQTSGKKVILSTLALIMNKRELQHIKDLTELNDSLLIEANDVATASLLAGKPHAIGPYINIYNEGTLSYFEQQGATQISLPGELPSTSLEILAEHVQSHLEIQVFGRLPLAISARCFHARSKGLHKDNCLFICENDTNGKTISTMDHTPFLTINGTQTLSFSYVNLIKELETLQQMGIHHFRISPHDTDMVAICTLFDNVIQKKNSAEEADLQLRNTLPDITFSNGFFYGDVGKQHIVRQDYAT